MSNESSNSNNNNNDGAKVGAVIGGTLTTLGAIPIAIAIGGPVGLLFLVAQALGGSLKGGLIGSSFDK